MNISDGASLPSPLPVSVVIPCYRCSGTIERAIASVAQQTSLPAEVILVDDASDEETLRILQNIARNHPAWVKVLQLKENVGAAGARNAGWEAAVQSYVAFLDADDTWHPEKLHVQYEYMSHHPDVALSGHQCGRLRGDEELPEMKSMPAASVIKAQGLIFRSCFSTPTAMLRRDIPFRFPGDRSHSEDLSLWQRIAFAGLAVVRLEAQLAFIHKAPYGEGGLSSHLWEMEKGELQNIMELRRDGKINWLSCVAAAVFSLAKYVRRLLLAGTKPAAGP